MYHKYIKTLILVLLFSIVPIQAQVETAMDKLREMALQIDSSISVVADNVLDDIRILTEIAIVQNEQINMLISENADRVSEIIDLQNRVSLLEDTSTVIDTSGIDTSEVIEGTGWFVDKTASGSNNGTSWDNAWTSFTNIVWSSIQPGDTIWVSGGTTSKTYTEALNPGKAGTNGNNIVITKGTSSGHNGEVILTAQVVFGGSDDFITLEYMSMRTSGRAIDVVGGYSGTNSDASYRFTNPVEGVKIRYINIHCTGGSGIQFKSALNCSTYHNTITTTTNTSSTTDGYFIQATKGIVIDGDSIIISNENTSPHCDAIQMNQDTSTIVRNCYIEHTDSKTSNSQGIYGTEGYGNLLYYNNVVNSGTSSSNSISARQLTLGNYTSITIVNNTVTGTATSSNQHGIWVTEFTGTPIVKNNIIAYYGVVGIGIYLTSYAGTTHNAQYNCSATRGADITTSDPLFTNRTVKDFTLQSGSPVKDNGATLTYATDKNGTARPIGVGWSRGAYEK